LFSLTRSTVWRQLIGATLALSALAFCAETTAPIELSPRMALQKWAEQKARTGFAACCGSEACAILEPTATAEEVDSYLRATIQVGSRFNTAGSRWNSTVRTPSTSRGDPIVITYSFVPDGVTIPSNSYNSQSPSNLNSAMNSQFGGSGWKDVFRQVFAKWSDLSGIRYVEVSDDGASWGSGGSSSRGDVRIYGTAIPSSVAAYNYYPGNGTGGDMVLDTSYGWNSSGTNHQGLRNVVAHEHGHGFGLGHCISNNSKQLMEPVLDTSFDGPQDDDIRGAQRLYGDTYERKGSTGTGHNNSTSTAADLGTISGTKTITNLSIDDGADVDYFKISLSSSVKLTVTATPQGNSYSIGNQGGSESTIDTRRIQDLRIDVLNSGGSTIGSANNTGLGSAETLSVNLSAGSYYVRIDDTNGASNAQLYTLALSTGTTSTTPPPAPTPAPTTQSPYAGSPVSLPGTIEAEKFDNGGEGVAYHDIDSGNIPGQFRSTDVDIESCVEGGYSIGYIRTGEWLEYTVNVASAGTYTVETRVASGASGRTFRIEFNGSSIGSFSVPYTGGWQNWQTISKTGVSLGAGTQVMRIYADSGDYNINWIRVSAGTTTSSGGTTGGSASIVPGRIEAEDYRAGGEGTGYHDTSAGNGGGAYRSDDVDIAVCSDSGGGYNVGWTAGGEWLAYNISASSSGTCTVTLRVATASTYRTIHLELDGARVGSTINVPLTNGWQNWANASTTINVPSGSHTLKVVFDNGDVNLNYISFASGAGIEEPGPAFGSVSATPQSVRVMEPVEFFAQALPATTEGAVTPPRIEWDFGDGTSELGAVATHTYSAAGTYDATAYIMDSNGRWTSESLRVVVSDVAGTPDQTLTVERLRANLVLSESGRDSWQAQASMSLPPEFDGRNLPVIVELAGSVTHVVLDSKGRANFDDGSVKLIVKSGAAGSTGRITINIKHAELAKSLEVYGAANGDIRNASITLPLRVTIGNTVYSGAFTGKYSARSGKTARVF